MTLSQELVRGSVLAMSARVRRDPPSGVQFEIAHGEHRATVVEVGGAVRTYAVEGRDVLEPFDVGAMADGAHGAVLAPWPNRLADGRYTFDGQEYQLALTEPATSNAIHGLLRWVAWRPVRHEADRVTLSARIHPQQGYPFDLGVQVAYALERGGLTVKTTATNLGDKACPYGTGQHPYLYAGGATLDECTAVLPAATRITTDGPRQLPTGVESVEDTPYDLRSGAPLTGLRLDDPFTDLLRDVDGRARVRLTSPDGRTCELWVDAAYGYLQTFSGETLAVERQRRALAVEPMTCPPNAFNSGEGLIRLEPGESTSSEWGVRLL
jgi:aldose 1-epimerase